MAKSPVRDINPDFLDAVSLPVMDAGSSLRSAMAEMKRARRYGLLVRSDDEASIVTAGQIEGAINSRARTLKEVEGIPVLVGDITLIAQSTPDLPISSDALLDALTSSGRKYGLLSAPTANVKNAIIFGFDDLTVMVRQPTPGSKKRTPPTVKPTNEIAG